jgi:hypothetical protein
MTFDPFAKPKHDLKTASKFFGKNSSAVDAMRLKNENPPLYDELRKSAEFEHNLIGPRGYFKTEDWKPADPNAKHYDEETLRARANYDRAACEALFKSTGSKHNAAELAKTPAAYRLAKLAAVSFDILPPDTHIPPVTVIPQQPVDTSVAIGNELADRLNLPRGYRAQSHDELQSIIRLDSEVQAAKAAAAVTADAEKVAVDPPSEKVAA